jgi:hypothetical protein
MRFFAREDAKPDRETSVNKLTSQEMSGQAGH